jgi:hypothetical protein
VSILRGFVNVSAHAFPISIRAHSPDFGHNAESEAEILSVPDRAQVVLHGASMTSISMLEARTLPVTPISTVGVIVFDI